MQNVILLVHLLLTMALIVAVLVQRSEGGGLGMGGGGNLPSGRSAATAMHKVTWTLGIGLFVTSTALTIIAAQSSSGTSVLDRLTDRPAAAEQSAPAAPDTGEDLLPPAAGDDAPLTPTAD